MQYVATNIATFVFWFPIFSNVFLIQFKGEQYSQKVEICSITLDSVNIRTSNQYSFFNFLETYDLDLTAIPSDEIDSVETESETDIEKTTCSVVFENSDSLVDNSEKDTDTDEDEEEEEEVEDDDSIDSLDEEDFEFISTDDL